MSDANPGPSSTPSSGGYLGASTASLRSEIRLLRVLLYAAIALTIVLMVGVAVGLAGINAQLADLRGAVAAVQVQAPVTPQPAAPAVPEPAATASLGPAVALTGVELPRGADPNGAVLIGDPNATTVVETYIDYQCPFCQRWESSFGTALIDRALQPGSGLLVKQYNMAFLGETSPTLDPAGASARAASAAACVVDRDGAAVFAAFSRAVFAAADPSEPPSQFTADALSGLARKAGASSDAVSCIEDERFVPFVAATTQSAFTRGVGGTPTVLVDGVAVENAFVDPRITDLTAGS